MYGNTRREEGEIGTSQSTKVERTFSLLEILGRRGQEVLARYLNEIDVKINITLPKVH